MACATCHPEHAGQGLRDGEVARGHAGEVRPQAGRVGADADACRGQVHGVPCSEVRGVAVGEPLGPEDGSGLHRARHHLHQLPRGHPPLGAGAGVHQVPRHRYVDRNAWVRSRHDRLSARRQAHRGEVREVPPGPAAGAEERRQGPPGAGVQAGHVRDLRVLPRRSAFRGARPKVRGVPHDARLQGHRQEPV